MRRDKIHGDMRKPGFKSALIATAVALAAATTFASIEFKSGGATLRLADANGAVESLVADGAERVGIYSRIPRYATPNYKVGRDDATITIRTEFPRGELCSKDGWMLCDEPFSKPVHVPPCGILVADIK